MEELNALVTGISSLYNTPLWILALIFFVLLMIAVEVGYRVGLIRRARWAIEDGEVGGGGVVLTAMFAIMGLIIAFTYSSSAHRYEARKAAVIAEANALGTAFLRANLVAEPGRTELKTALYHYALTRAPSDSRARLGIFTEQQRLDAIRSTVDALSALWPITEDIVTSTPNPGVIESSLVGAINEVLNVHTIRIAALFDKLPDVVTWMLVVIAAASLSVTGYNAGVSGHVSRWRLTIFAFVLAGMMVVILDFDRPGNGMIRVTRASVNIVIDDMANDLEVHRP